MSGAEASTDASLKGGISSFGFFIRNAPLSMLAAAIPGAVNYGILVFLTRDPGFEEAGNFRLMLSIYGLIGLAAMAETHKIYVRSIVAGDESALAALWLNRLIFAALPFVILLAGFYGGPYFGIWEIPASYLGIAAISVVVYTTDFYIGRLQARALFGRLFVIELAKYTAALAVFLFAIHETGSVETAVLMMLTSIAITNCFLTLICTKMLLNFGRPKRAIALLLQSNPARQARTYSFANMLPASLEHIDKLLVGWIFGLELLGIYALAFSTGRLVYNVIKPSFYIYYRRFVGLIPSRSTFWKIGIAATIVGGLLAASFWLIINHWPAMERFKPGAVVTILLFWGYGIGIVRAVYVQAVTLNRDSIPIHTWRASLSACLLTIPLLLAALSFKPAIALTLLALQYPARDLATICLLARYRRLSK